MSDTLKFYLKRSVMGIMRSFLLLFSVAPNTDGWEDRVLIVTLDLIGDMAAFTAILRHYREAMPKKKIFLLVAGGGFDVLMGEYVDGVFSVNGERFKKNPWYGYQTIACLRRVGFRTVIEQNPSLEFLGKTIATELKAQDVIGYEGYFLEQDLPPNETVRKNVAYVRRVLMPKFTRIISNRIEDHHPQRLAHMIRHYAAIFEGATGVKVSEYVPKLPDHISTDEDAKKKLAARGIAVGSYALLAFGTTATYREWEIEKFIAVGKQLAVRNIPMVIVGTPKDSARAEAFVAAVGESHCYNLVGATSIIEVVSFIRYSLFSFSNETGIVHLAIALQKPSLTILGLGHFGRMSAYGYPGINRWVYDANLPCLCDNWRCGLAVASGRPAPCIAAVGVDRAIRALDELLHKVKNGESRTSEKFQVEFTV